MNDNIKDLMTADLGAAALAQRAAGNILACNGDTEKYGLCLTPGQARALVQTETETLKKTGRIELGQGIICRLISRFADSPYISPQNYEQTLHELTGLFYDFKNETCDAVSDNELADFMKESYNNYCGGSIRLLEQQLQQLARHIRSGGTAKNFKTE